MFYFLLALTAVLAATTNASRPIVDRDGYPIVDGSYYVVPLLYGPSTGGLNLNPRSDNPCPLYVGAENGMVLDGIPIRFSNWASRVEFVPESENLNIEMNIKKTTCGNSTYWRVASSQGDGKPRFIAAGIKPQPGDADSRNFFQIKKYEPFINGYKFAFCPNHNNCTDIGIYWDENNEVQRLALTSSPFRVAFQRAFGVEETSSKTMSII